MSGSMERVVYVQQAVLEIRELNSWVHVEGYYQGSGVHILSIQDSKGRVYAPQLQMSWSEVAEGIVSRRQEVLPRNYSHEVRVDAMILPVRILFRSWFQSVNPEGSEENSSDSRYWVRYVRSEL